MKNRPIKAMCDAACTLAIQSTTHVNFCVYLCNRGFEKLMYIAMWLVKSSR